MRFVDISDSGSLAGAQGEGWVALCSSLPTQDQTAIIEKAFADAAIPESDMAYFDVRDASDWWLCYAIVDLGLPTIRFVHAAEGNLQEAADLPFEAFKQRATPVRMSPGDLWRYSLDAHETYQYTFLLSELCNIRCTMCPLFSTNPDYDFVHTRINKKRSQNMDLAVYEKIMSEISHQKQRIRLSGNGEPLMHPQFMKFVELASKNGHDICINTNGLLLNKEMIARLAELGVVSMVFSVEGITKESYESVRVGGVFEKVVENMQECMNLAKAGKAKWRIHVYYNELPELPFSREEVAAFFTGKAHDINFRNPMTDAYCEKYVRHPDFDKGEFQYCFDMMTHPYVDPYGRVIPCATGENLTWFEEFPWLKYAQDENIYDILKSYKESAKRGEFPLDPICVHKCQFWNASYRIKGTRKDPIFQIVDLES